MPAPQTHSFVSSAKADARTERDHTGLRADALVHESGSHQIGECDSKSIGALSRCSRWWCVVGSRYLDGTDVHGSERAAE